MTKSKILNEKKPLKNGFFSFIIFLFGVLLLFQLLSRFVILFSAYDQVSTADILDLFYHGIRQDISISAYFTFLTLVAYLLFHISKKNVFLVFFRSCVIMIVLLHLLIVVVDIELLKHWSRKMDLQALFYLKFPSQVLQNLPNTELILLSLVILLLTVIISWLILRIVQIKIQNDFALSAKKALLVLPLFFLAMRGGVGLMPVLISDASYSEDQIKNSIATNSVWNFFYQLTEAGGIQEVDHLLNPTMNVSGMIDKYLLPNNEEPICFYWDKTPNVVLIILEGFTAEMSSFFGGHDGNEMPFIDSLAREGYAFTKVYASGDRTDKGLLSILSGWPGQTWQNIINHPSKLDKLPALAKALHSKRGYNTRFYYGGDLNFANMEFYLKMNGFQTQIGKNNIQLNRSKMGKWGVNDQELFDFVASDLNHAKTPYFASILTLSTHEPFDLAPKELFHVKDKMAYCMRYTDLALRNFMLKMSHSADFKNTLFVITADHGKELNTSNTARFNQNFFHIPLVFYGQCLPQIFKNKINKTIVSQADIYQSLHHLILQKIDENAHFSRSFFASSHPKNAICNLTGTTMFVDSLSCDFLNTDKMTIKHKKIWNSNDSLLFGVQSKIIQDFFK